MSNPADFINQHISQRLANRRTLLSNRTDLPVYGQLTQMIGLTLEAVGCPAPIGSRCLVATHDKDYIEAEIVGFNKEKTYLMATEALHGLQAGAQVIPQAKMTEVPVGEALLGRIVDGTGTPLDGGAPILAEQYYPLQSSSLNPLARQPIRQPLDVGVRAINSMLSVGMGQRLGLFAGSGVGKSVLLSMMTRFTNADVIVVGLIGERGREVKEFIEENLGAEGLARSVIVAAPADTTPLMRLHGAMFATSVAEYFRDQGANVLLLMDSLTRFAQAQRELSLAIGEPPATKGYTPSVFAKLNSLVERAGSSLDGKGSITAFYTVLTEGDDQQDPIADAARAILDGHIVLSRSLAEAGHYPAIDIDASISRVMEKVVSPEFLAAALELKKLYAKYQQNKDLITVGAYVKGTDPEIDKAIYFMPMIEAFLQQSISEQVDMMTSQQTLLQLVTQIRGMSHGESKALSPNNPVG